MPEDWYDDEEENEHKETENKEEVSRTTDPVDTENKKDEVREWNIRSQSILQEYTVYDRGYVMSTSDDSKQAMVII